MAKRGRPLIFKNKEELQKKIDEYFESCKKRIIKRIVNKNSELVSEISAPSTITGLASFLGTSRETLMNYEKKEDFFDTIKKAKAKIESIYEERALIGDYNPAVSIFALKNNFNWRDKSETDITSGGNPIPILKGETNK